MNQTIKAIIGLGNPGTSHYLQRHSIGFRIIDALAQRYGGTWKKSELMEQATITMHEHPVLLIKPLTYMNSSGKVIPFLSKKGISAENIVVVHDELELPFGVIKIKTGGSAKGHNGLRSLIVVLGEQFLRLRIGIGRPASKEEVPDYVLAPFTEPSAMVTALIEQAVKALETIS
jgi:peptidyl-tRNA hydrolase, PTH1 family